MEQVRPAYLNVSIVRVRVRDGLESNVLVADFCGQVVDDTLHLLHNLGELLAPRAHLGGKGSAQTVIPGAGPRHWHEDVTRPGGRRPEDCKQACPPQNPWKHASRCDGTCWWFSVLLKYKHSFSIYPVPVCGGRWGPTVNERRENKKDVSSYIQDIGICVYTHTHTHTRTCIYAHTRVCVYNLISGMRNPMKTNKQEKELESKGAVNLDQAAGEGFSKEATSE